MDQPPPQAAALQPPLGIVAGAVCGLIAAVLYTCSNVALRQSVGLDPFLVSAMKAAPTVVVLAPVVVLMRLSGQTIATSLAMLPRFFVCSLFAQVVGNGSFQFSLGAIGLAATVPIVLGVLIISGGLLGRVMLGEPVRRQTILAMLMLIVAVVVLSMPEATRPPSQSLTVLPVWAGVMCAVASGFAYSLFGVVLRQTLNGGISAPATLLISGVAGTVSLWGITFCRIDAHSLALISPSEWTFLVAGGVFNFTAFVALSLSLKSLPVVSVNLINASQVAMAALAGVMLFAEPVTMPLLVGIALTFAGLMMLAWGRNGRRNKDPVEANR